MKTNKRGISLIVLVITIIVIIILAAAVILTLNGNNQIDNSKQATFDNDCAELKSAMSMYMTTFMANDLNHDGPFDTSAITIVQTVDTESGQKEAKLATAVGTTRTAGNVVTWKTLGFSGKPASIDTATYDPATGLFDITATNTEVDDKVDW